MRFTQSHEWIEVEGSVGTVGISRFAQKELGEIVYVQLPKLGQPVKKNQELCVLESTKAAADVYCPVSGIVVSVNEEAGKDPSLVNQSPETSGWLFRVKLSEPNEIESLLTKEQYLSLIDRP